MLQYLELAYYVVHGTCPDEKSRRFLLMETKFKRYSTETTPHWDVFHRMTSTQLNAQSHSWQSWETCFCNSEEDRVEYRNFVYNMREEQVRYFITPIKKQHCFGSTGNVHYTKRSAPLASSMPMRSTVMRC